MPKQNTNFSHIIIQGARVHNLKNIDLTLPRDKFIVVTGVSGSGKSSLAFDTLYAEGQRRYVESLSSYARQFLGRIEKPDVDYIYGLPPAIAIEQKVNTRNPRSTVGTSTEIYDYLKLLFARTGKTYSPVSGALVRKDTVTDVVDYLVSLPANERVLLMAPLKGKKENLKQYSNSWEKEGITRLEINKKVWKSRDIIENKIKISPQDEVNIVIDRLKIKNSEDSKARYADSAEIAFSKGNGKCIVRSVDSSATEKTFSNRFELDGIEFEEPDVHMFSFNNPIGACPKCEGYGKIIGIDEELVVPDKRLSVYEDAIACWRGEKMQEWKNKLIANAHKFNFPIHKPFYNLTESEKNLLWQGNKYFHGLNTFFKYLEKKKYKIQYRVMLSRYRGKTTCPGCQGTRLKKEASYVKVGGRSIQELVLYPVDQLHSFFSEIQLDDYDLQVSERILTEILNRLNFLKNVGLSYLNLNRLSSTLSGGESQRINLATSLGSSLVGSMYILDEPSIGLHPRDNEKLIYVLKHLQQIGNSVIVVEHDEDIIRSADEIIDLGPDAGRLGGKVVFQGTQKEIQRCQDSYTGQFLSDIEFITVPSQRRKWNNYIELIGARENNLKGINVRFPLNVITLITGVSGSGKSSLLKNILFPLLNRYYHGTGQRPGKHDDMRGDLDLIQSVEYIDQNPIGKSSRSNPVTYIKAYDDIRKLFASQQAAKINHLKPSHFSFNTTGGRCEECQGEGTIKVEMQFMPDVTLKCEVCKGKRFKDEVLEVKYKGKSIYDVLEMTINEALEFFDQEKNSINKKIIQKLRVLQSMGLGYLKLGQPSSTLSGGESQRIKLAFFISLENKNSNTLFLFDEPSTGLHYHDITNLLKAFNELIRKGHTIIIIEHNMEIIKSADWIIDLGPEGGEKGGEIVDTGTPEKIGKNPTSYTGTFLKEKL